MPAHCRVDGPSAGGGSLGYFITWHARAAQLGARRGVDHRQPTRFARHRL